jgi:hypothetical protein
VAREDVKAADRFLDAEAVLFRPRIEKELASWRADGENAIEQVRLLTELGPEPGEVMIGKITPWTKLSPVAETQSSVDDG